MNLPASPEPLSVVCRYRSSLIRDHSSDQLRSGEGSLLPLSPRKLALVYTEFTGGRSDDSRAHLVLTISHDEGESWSVPKLFFQPPPDACNAMGASLLRLHDGRIACTFAIKYSLLRLTPYCCFSSDNGESWTPPQAVTAESGYFVINNDRLIQTRDGLLILPYALHEGIGTRTSEGEWEPCWNARCGLFYSKDGGRNWQRSAHTITHTPDIFHEPLHRIADLPENVNREFALGLGIVQEPGVQELEGGSLMLYMRSLTSIYRCFSQGVEASWESCAPIPGLHVCLSAPVIRSIPGSNRLLMFYNDRGAIPFGTPEFARRTPHSVAISDDAGRTWQRIGQLESDEKAYCYFSLWLDEHKFYTTCYESVLAPDDSLQSLASLKFGKGEIPPLLAIEPGLPAMK
ncbi:MAG TPA: sialidase family protein [Chthoniobacteraceae bacterium]|nr:sialidase family protein [Chthoniobacteraceae bacterium]